MRAAILGFGLIGGSVARAVRSGGPEAHDPVWRLVAWSPTGRGAARALADGVIDEAPRDPAGAVRDADVVILAAPPLACLELLDVLGGPLRRALGDALVTDVASTKRAIVARAASHRLRFVGGHPMAGRETTGYDASDGALFADRPWVVTPDGAADADVATIEALARRCGARPLVMDAAAHDAAVAAISHLPLVLSAALVEAVAGTPSAPRGDWPAAASLAATGWRDMTRLARGDVAMGAGIAATNADALVARLRDVRAILDDWIAELDAPEDGRPESLAARLRAAREVLENPPESPA
ncbi:MAG TPA: prephenate dehydrogenase/arogenate dehydrogenase family protein [Candidatus Limnocylindrales bacterium]|nr:prephenate dehydrogenase/arogenate dehydrogenase family protein [Candidatus Limnocylindrales bacterium]